MRRLSDTTLALTGVVAPETRTLTRDPPTVRPARFIGCSGGREMLKAAPWKGSRRIEVDHRRRTVPIYGRRCGASAGWHLGRGRAPRRDRFGWSEGGSNTVGSGRSAKLAASSLALALSDYAALIDAKLPQHLRDA